MEVTILIVPTQIAQNMLHVVYQIIHVQKIIMNKNVQQKVVLGILVKRVRLMEEILPANQLALAAQVVFAQSKPVVIARTWMENIWATIPTVVVWCVPKMGHVVRFVMIVL
jgi:hypothetical protein